MSTHLYTALTTRQTARFRAPLDFLLVAPARQYPLLSRLRRQLVAHGKMLRAHGHGLAWLRVSWMRVVLRHSMLGRGERRAHGLAWLLLLRRHLLLGLGLLAVDSYGRQIERRQIHVGALGRAIGLCAWLTLRGRIGVGGHLW